VGTRTAGFDAIYGRLALVSVLAGEGGTGELPRTGERAFPEDLRALGIVEPGE
jgi:hypothetical protein